jgi:UDPglucose 6-dehydrogenase
VNRNDLPRPAPEDRSTGGGSDEAEPEPDAIGIVGLGFVGIASAAAFVHYGRSVICFDISAARREQVRRGDSPMYEAGLGEFLRATVGSGRLHVVDSLDALVTSSATVFLCVPTPATEGGGIDLHSLERAATEVGASVARVDTWRSVIVKSTAVPGTAESTVAPLVAKASGRTVDVGFGIASNPEFLSEGTLVEDALHPSRIVIGVREGRTRGLLEEAYRGFPAPLLVLRPAGAELLKYAWNALLATRISFANEVAALAETLGVDIRDVMDGVGKDPSVGSGYLRAGPGFGGSCLGKDLTAIVEFARQRGVDMRLLRATLEVNRSQPAHVVDLAAHAAGGVDARTVALLGLSFKAGTDDVRDSQAYPLLRELVRRGARVRLFDPVATEAFLRGLPSDWRAAHENDFDVLAGLEPTVRGADLAIIQADWPEFRAAPSEWWATLRMKLVVDSRRTLDPAELERNGVRYVAVGR